MARLACFDFQNIFAFLLAGMTTAQALRGRPHAFGWPPSEMRSAEMDRQLAVVLYVIAMVAVIVGVDLGFFRNRFWERLMVNVGIVLLFGAFYLRFLRRP
jgi:hypothetical protein